MVWVRLGCPVLVGGAAVVCVGFASQQDCGQGGVLLAICHIAVSNNDCMRHRRGILKNRPGMGDISHDFGRPKHLLEKPQAQGAYAGILPDLFDSYPDHLTCRAPSHEASQDDSHED